MIKSISGSLVISFIARGVIGFPCMFLAILFLFQSSFAGDIQRGITFTNGQTLTASQLQQLVDNATILPYSITNKAAKTTLASNDFFVLFDSTSGSLKKATFYSLQNSITNFNFSTMTVSNQANFRGTNYFNQNIVTNETVLNTNFVNRGIVTNLSILNTNTSLTNLTAKFFTNDFGTISANSTTASSAMFDEWTSAGNEIYIASPAHSTIPAGITYSVFFGSSGGPGIRMANATGSPVVVGTVIFRVAKIEFQ